MMRVTTLYASTAAATAGYYTKYLTQAEGEIPGVWAGRQAARFGLVGSVDAERLERLLSGCDPNSGLTLGYPLVDRTLADGRVVRAVSGFDATISAPKSLSVWWALTGDQRLLDAHDAAVKATIDALQRYGATTRIRSNGGRLHPDTEGLTIAVGVLASGVKASSMGVGTRQRAELKAIRSERWQVMDNCRDRVGRRWAGAVRRARLSNGQLFLPVGGHWFCPLAATSGTAQSIKSASGITLLNFRARAMLLMTPGMLRSERIFDQLSEDRDIQGCPDWRIGGLADWRIMPPNPPHLPRLPVRANCRRDRILTGKEFGVATT